MLLWAGATAAAGVLAGCGSSPSAKNPDHCAGERATPTIEAHHALPTGTAGGPNAWFELVASQVEGDLADNQVLLDGVPVPVVRVTARGPEDHAMDATAGQLQPRSARTAAASAPSLGSHVVGFRIPAGARSGVHALSFRTCQAASEATIAYEVLPNPAPVVSGVKVVRGPVWPMIYITGAHLSDAEEVVLVGGDGAVTTLTNVTRVDDAQLRVAVETSGTYEVYVKSPNGLGGGPPGGAVTVR